MFTAVAVSGGISCYAASITIMNDDDRGDLGSGMNGDSLRLS